MDLLHVRKLYFYGFKNPQKKLQNLKYNQANYIF